MIACICLTADRPEMTARALDCFLKQETTEDVALFLYDTGKQKLKLSLDALPHVRHAYKCGAGETIGELRNSANKWAVANGATILLHWDSDDWYHPRYVETQIQRLRARHAGRIGCIGYREAVFFDTIRREAWRYHHPGEHYCIGASFCYWASCWQQMPFEHTSSGEDSRWLRNVQSVGFALGALLDIGAEPPMIASIHAGNTATGAAFLHRHDPHDTSWHRAPQYDAYCRERLEK